LPRESLGNDADAFASVLDKGDIERIGAEQSRRQFPHVLHARHPTRFVDVAVGSEIVTPFTHRSLGAHRQRRDGGVIEKRPPLGHRHLAAQCVPVHMQALLRLAYNGQLYSAIMGWNSASNRFETDEQMEGLMFGESVFLDLRWR